jgi:hypothetical protein
LHSKKFFGGEDSQALGVGGQRAQFPRQNQISKYAPRIAHFQNLEKFFDSSS